MVDIWVRLSRAPDLRVLGEVALHILVHFFLKIDPDLPEGSDYDIRADAAIEWDVASWVIDLDPGRVVADGVAGLLDCCFDDDLNRW
jgi:hypothetical protein